MLSCMLDHLDLEFMHELLCRVIVTFMKFENFMSEPIINKDDIFTRVYYRINLWKVIQYTWYVTETHSDDIVIQYFRCNLHVKNLKSILKIHT